MRIPGEKSAKYFFGPRRSNIVAQNGHCLTRGPKSGRGQPHSKTLARPPMRQKTRSVLEGGCPPAYFAIFSRALAGPVGDSQSRFMAANCARMTRRSQS